MNKPNILIILADQQRYDTIGAAGYEHMITPNLDKLVEEGCLYKNAHTHNPVCMPARHDLLIGMPAGAHGYFANKGGSPIKDYGIPTLPGILSENGYRTAAIGKMHFSPVRMHHGYSEMHLMEEIPRRRQDDAYATYLKKQGLGAVQNIHGIRPLLYHRPQQAQVDEAHYETNWVKNRTIQWLNENGEHPFMLCVGYIKPHPPWDIPKNFQGLYKDKVLPKAIERSRSYPCSNEADPWYGDLDDEDKMREIREAYYTSVTMVDESVGHIMEHLRSTGQLDNTLVIYTSDHGEMLQDKGYYSKSLPYDSSVRVPFIVRYPKSFPAGTLSEAFVDLTDILPTCLDVTGTDYPGDESRLYGGSLLKGESDRNRETIISACGFLHKSRWVMCRHPRYKYVYQYNGGKEEMYDLVNDPEEVHNVIASMEGSEMHLALRKQVLDYEKEWGPEGAVVDGELVVLNHGPLDGHVRGKYHIWSNSQFQPFYEGEASDRGLRFADEVCHAVGGDVRTGVDTLDHEQWLEAFEEQFDVYGGGVSVKMDCGK